MDPKDIDRGGKGVLVALAAVIVAAAKKYGPKIIKNIKQTISKKQRR